MMSKTLILQQQARRVLTNHSIKTCLIRRSYNTLPAVKAGLEKWSKQDDQVIKPSHVRVMIKNLSDSKKFSNALEASEWMCEQRVFNIFSEDYASRLNLVETVLGLEEAEKFFETIPENMRDYTVYNNLLRSYTKSGKTLDKAEATFEKMRDLGFLLKPSPYKSMISLYGQLKNQDMVKKLQRELIENNVEIKTLKVMNKDDECRLMISSLLKKDDVKEAEKVYKEWEPKGPKLDMSIPSLLISFYLSKGNETKVEELIKSIRKKRIFMHLKRLIKVLIVLVTIMGVLAIVVAIIAAFAFATTAYSFWIISLFSK